MVTETGIILSTLYLYTQITMSHDRFVTKQMKYTLIIIVSLVKGRAYNYMYLNKWIIFAN